jgi:hypothetical protein
MTAGPEFVPVVDDNTGNRLAAVPSLELRLVRTRPPGQAGVTRVPLLLRRS